MIFTSAAVVHHSKECPETTNTTKARSLQSACSLATEETREPLTELVIRKSVSRLSSIGFVEILLITSLANTSPRFQPVGKSLPKRSLLKHYKKWMTHTWKLVINLTILRAKRRGTRPRFKRKVRESGKCFSRRKGGGLTSSEYTKQKTSNYSKNKMKVFN